MSYKNPDTPTTWDDIKRLIKEENRAIVVFEDGVYDATDFKITHPGGPKFIDDHIGQDITEEFYDAEHTKIALRLLNEIKIGRLAEGEHQTDDGDNLNNKERMKEIEGEAWRKLIDPSKGTVYQVFKKLNLEDYTNFINDPKHLTKPGEKMRMFDNEICETLSNTPWYHVPMFWFPVATYFVWKSTYDLTPEIVALSVILGMVTWTFVEYTLHRFLFHIEQFMTDNSFLITLHYILHGVHHAFPMDRGRLVFPIAAGIPMSFLVYSFLMLVYPDHWCDAIFGGLLYAYQVYDCGHYYLHHSQPLKFVEYRKKYHMYHHYKDPDNGYGITCSFWDKVFGTELDMTKQKDKVVT